MNCENGSQPPAAASRARSMRRDARNLRASSAVSGGSGAVVSTAALARRDIVPRSCKGAGDP